MNRKLIFAVLASLICFAIINLSAQTSDSAPQARRDRPRVGVALSGGGALGLAHIGVLLYFEEHRIPIDAVAGTSMGGLVGGFYAAGLNAAEIQNIAENANWDYLLNPNPRYRDQPIVEKQSWNQSYGTLTVRLGRRFSLPQGINSGEALAMMLSRYTAGYGELASFDELPTPFRCVATDLIKADGVVLNRGPLAKAMRATMALPAIFTPVRWDDMVLVDGGIVQNLPVETAREMGAQKTIAIKLLTATPRPKDLNSLSTIALRSVSVAIEQNERRSTSNADLVIEVNTAKFVGTDYTHARDLIRAGYEAAHARERELRDFEVNEEEWQEYIDSRRMKTVRTPAWGAVVAVQSQPSSFRENAADELHRKLGSQPVSVDTLEDTVSGMVAATGVPGASYRWDKDKKGYTVEFLERPGESVLIRPSFVFSTSPGEPSQAALRLSLTRITETAYKSRSLAAITVGYDPGIRTEYYRPIGGTGYFVAPGLLVERKHFNSYTGPSRIAPTRDRFAGSFYAGIGTWRFIQTRVGLTGGFDSYSKDENTDGVIARSHAFANPEITWTYNTLDSGGLAYRGTKIEGSLGYSFRDTSHPYLNNEVTSFVPMSNRVSWVFAGQLGSTFGEKVNLYEQFTSGGAGQLSAFRYQEFHANTLATAGGGFIFHAPPVRRLSVYPGLALIYEAGRFDLGSRGWETHQSATTGVFFPTPIGAAGLSVSFNEDGKARFRLSLGALGKR